MKAKENELQQEEEEGLSDSTNNINKKIKTEAISYCINAASISAGLNTFPTCPRYFKLYSLSNDGEALALFLV